MTMDRRRSIDIGQYMAHALVLDLLVLWPRFLSIRGYVDIKLVRFPIHVKDLN